MEKSSDASTSQVTFRRVALLSCGTFSPPTYMHLRMFERARDYLKKIHGWEVVEGIMSPIADSLGRPDMVPAKHRLKMVELAVKSSSWIRADGWECSQGEWIRTIHVLHHFKEVLNQKYQSENFKVRLLLLCGGDVIESITKLAVSDVMLWNTKQIEEVVRDFGVVVVMRANTDPVSAIYLADVLHTYQKNIFVIEDETCPNDISSTRLRTAIRRKESIRYCTSDEVIHYIEDNSLYGATSLPPTRVKVQNICRSASSANISASNSSTSFGNCLKHSRFSLLPLKQTAEEDNHKTHHDHSPEEEKQSFILESSPIWYPSSSLPSCSLLTEKPVSTTRSLSHLQKTRPLSMQNKYCHIEISDTAAPKQSKHAHFRSLESPDCHNLTPDKMLTLSSDWADYIGVKKEEEIDELTTSQIADLRDEQSNLQIKMPTPVQRKNYETQIKRRSVSAVSRSVGSLTSELSLAKEDKSRSLSHVRSEEESEESNNVTLTYRKYKLASTPETTV
uniref:Nicotinamide/nicotinic acid mononucleotide adenylyltransferase 3 n=1 Tax=Elaeophora elaphi TaxID=1147741 RepID=A0A0R3S5L5_9BILA